MGCCQSRPIDNHHVQVSNTPQVTTNTQSVPSIVITKTHSTELPLPPPSSSTNPVTTQETDKRKISLEQEQSSEKPPVDDREEKATPPPVFNDLLSHKKATEQDVKASENHHAPVEEATNEWPILIRRSNSSLKDTLIQIPVSEPFMTVSDLKGKIDIDDDQQIKLIHLGRILQDHFILIPSSVDPLEKKNTIKVSHRGVIQAMIYRN
ncbi:uncharacterized protein B0P05DRAFT_520885 [Gilbertella persicaria]|uniref:uncharacterized protein n=1 Tax=Gilbertella persicaria TaxID=101096 RepID=UPI00221F2C5B|nr:uncharacterized protein B0P05DRAFT_520885 [Gilbertella persicaria]KAI8098201.1 hypothetical protein B0P05DRAFT_520885 [Gilbertella persicaria]